MESEKVFTVAITGAAGQIGYSLIPIIASGQTFGKDVKLNLRLLDIESQLEKLKGVVMEVQDCAFPLVLSIEYGADPTEIFKDVNVAVFVGGFPRLKGMERKDLIDKNVSIFKDQGKALNDVADPNCKVLVVANPANTNCLVLSKNAPNIPRENFTAMTRLDHDRALNQIALRTKSRLEDVKDVIIWGNHSSTQYPDVRFAKIKGENLDSASDEEFYHGEFITTVQKRGAAIIEARGFSSSMSAANAASNHLRDWYHGSDEVLSMSILSDGTHYDIEENLCFSFPVKCTGDFKHEVIDGLAIDDFSREKLNITQKELIEERELGEEQ